MNRITMIPAGERVVDTGDGCSSSSGALHHGLKGLVWIKDVIQNFTSPEQTVVALLNVPFLP